jgi:two-component system chemotaxis response regulator CheB
VVVLHRGKHYASDLESILQRKVKLTVKEIEEKEIMRPGYVYLAPANYHVLIEENRTFSFDLFTLVNHSRPSIDVTFESAAEVFTSRLMGILLTGANKDGAQGLKIIAEKGGFTIVQDPLEAESGTMPKSALEISTLHRILTLDQMKALLIGLHALAI